MNQEAKHNVERPFSAEINTNLRKQIDVNEFKDY